MFITGLQTDSPAGKKKDAATRNTLYVFDYDGITVAHLGDLQQVPRRRDRSLGTVNVALVPVGGGGRPERRQGRRGHQPVRAEHRYPDALCHPR